MLDPSLSWDDVAEMVRSWNGKFCLKGIMSGAGAKRAAEIACAVIVLSNHGGRQLDGSREPFDHLAEIVVAVGVRIDVLMDGGIQRGTRPPASAATISIRWRRPARPASSGCSACCRRRSRAT